MKPGNNQEEQREREHINEPGVGGGKGRQTQDHKS